MAEEISLDMQKEALTGARSRQFRVLIDSGIVQKAMRIQSDNPRMLGFNESLPVVLASDSDDLLILFLGFQKITSIGDGVTKLIQVGSVRAEDEVVSCEGFDSEDVNTVVALHNEIARLRLTLMPDLDMETGQIHG